VDDVGRSSRQCSFDVDNNSIVDPLTDGVLIHRALLASPALR